METTHYPHRAGFLAFAILVCLIWPTSSIFAQLPTVTVRFANPTYSCETGQYCLDVEFLSDSIDVEVFGMNVRFFYDDAIMELDSFTDFQGGYGPVTPDPPLLTQSPAGVGYTLFQFGNPGTGVADFVNGAMMLLDEMQPPLLLDTAVWTKLFQVCFTIENPGMDSSSFCPPVVWDLEQNPANGGFLIGDDGVVITIVSPDPNVMSDPSSENVVQFNWEYIGVGTPPYGQPVDSVCISLECIPTITCPADITLQCTDSTAPLFTGMASVDTVCLADVTVTFSDEQIPGICPQAFTIERSWIAMNACNISDTCIQLLTVIDTTPPVIVICPDDITISIVSSTDPVVTGMAAGTDVCDPGPLVVMSDDITLTGPCEDSYYIERTWSVADACGNSTTCQQIIFVSADCIFDLSLDKVVDGTFGPYTPGSLVDFTITITNEGDYAVGAIEVTDYIPVGMALLDSDWTAGINGSTGQSASIVLSIGNGALPPIGLLPGANVQVTITLQVQPSVTEGILENIAEISSFSNTEGMVVEDTDSTPDTDDTNDLDGEDDIDPAEICVLSPPVILGDTRLCPGESGTYTIENYNPAFTYSFELEPGGGTIVETGPDFVTIVWSGTPGGPYSLTVTAVATIGCEISSFIDIYIEGGDEIACNHHINFSIDNECGTILLSGNILTGVESGNNGYQVYIISMNGDTLPGDSLTWEHVGQTFKVSVVSECYGQSCWGSVTVEDKLPPIIDCVCAPGETSVRCAITCQQIDAFLAGDIPDEFRPVVIDSCGETTLDLINVELEYDPCTNGMMRVHWKATDSSGNTSTCEQEFDIIPLTLGEVLIPLDYPGECDDDPHPDNTGWPLINGIEATPDIPWCNLYVYYTDQTIQLCGGGRKIIRYWNLIDWCTSESMDGVQTIYLRDTEGPVLTCNPMMTVSTGLWTCQADVIVPKPMATDDCSEIKSYQLFSSAGQVFLQGNTYIIKGLPVGSHTATWVVKDECHNSSTCSVNIQVADLVPPVVSCHLHTVVALSEERPHGVTLVPASSFSDGSIDNCGTVMIRARRMDSCIDFDWTTGGACVDDLPGGFPPVNGFDAGTEYSSCVPFACCDVGRDDIMVQVEVTDAAGNVNYCMVLVEVQDKIAPDMECAQDIVVSCEFLFTLEEGIFSDRLGNQDGSLDEDPLSEVFGNFYDGTRHHPSDRQSIIIHDPDNPDLSQPHNWGLEGWGSDMCEIDLSVEVVVIDDCSGESFNGIVPVGAVKLIQRRFRGFDGSKTGSCTQRIWVVDFNRFYIADTNCNNEDPNDGVIWPCDILINTCPDDLGDTGEPVIVNDGCSQIGISHEDTRIDFADGACYKILREWKILDWCQFDPLTGYGRWTYTQAIKVADSEGVTFLDAPTEPQSYCTDDPGISLPANNQIFLGENNPNASSCSVHVNLGLRVEEFCSESVRYDVKIYPFNGLDFIQLVPETEVDLDENHQAEIRFNTKQSSDIAIATNGLPYNDGSCSDYHRVLWSVEDGCGNRSYADYLFALWDCKNPSPVCIDGLSTVVMPQEGEVTIYASSFNASSVDDCRPEDRLLFSFSGDVYMPSFTYTCDNVPEFGVELDEEIWVADGGADFNCDGTIEWSERNTASCIATIVITDNNDICQSKGTILSGEVMTEFSDAISPVTVHLTSPSYSIPSEVTSTDGQFAFSDIPEGAEYTITPTRDDDHQNGVNTLDLVFIQKHLLGQQTFTSPYQYIAADANNSQSISAIDIIEIRKVILGLQDTFAYNESWRFVQEGSPMAPGHPWPFNESIHVEPPHHAGGHGMDFVGVKIGDVNHSAKANANQILPRSGGKLVPVKVTTVDKMVAGTEIEVSFDFPNQVAGFQWTLQMHGLEFVEVKGRNIDIGDQHIGKHAPDLITMSWNGETKSADDGDGTSFMMKFIVRDAGRLLDMLDISDSITIAEAFTAEGESMDVDLAFSSLDVLTEFALYQNKPNPWTHQTHIGFYLPQDSKATLSVYDVEGKILKVVEAHYKAGFNSITLNRDDYPHAGILYYRLDSGPWSATKKMVSFQ